MVKKNRIYHFEIALYVFITLVVLAVPLFMGLKDGHDWSMVFREWRSLIPYFIIFLVNNFVFVPKLLFRSRYSTYILSCIGLLLVITFLNNFLLESRRLSFPVHDNKGERGRYERPVEGRTRPVDAPTPPFDFADRPAGNKHPMPPHIIFFNIGVFIIGFLIIGFNSGVKVFVYWMNEQEEQGEKERHYLTTELALLKHQVSPHFFMNTLNNIHALVDIDSEQAKDAIIKLSRLMRYLLYETDSDKVLLSREIGFMESYLDLMRLRYESSRLSLNISYPEDTQKIVVPSLLFLPLIENSFKHGVDNNRASFVDVHFKIQEESLILIIKNSNYARKKSDLDETSGIGLENIRKRLNLIYKTNYILLINPGDEVYEVSLAIPVERIP